MLDIALADNSHFKVDQRELENSMLTYTVDTLQSLRADLGTIAPLALLIGADQFQVFHTWHRWNDIFTLAHLVVAERPGAEANIHGLLQPVAEAVSQRFSDHPRTLHDASAGRVFRYALTPLAISSSGIRAALKSGRTPRYLLPDAVLDYIRHNNLYA